MNTADIARKILEIRRRPSPFIMNGELMLLLGPDGFQEALNRRWLIQDSENGAMLVTPLEQFIDQMRRLAEAFPSQPQEEDPQVGDSVYVASDGQTYDATVQAKEGESYKLSFQPGKAPSRPNPAYKKDELKRYARPDQKPKPGTVPVGQKAPASSSPYNPPLGLGNQLRNVPQ